MDIGVYMTATWTVLASGSRGNSSLLNVGESGLLIDLGMGPRQFDNRLQSAGFHWDRVRAVVLTHTHSDHWNESSLARLVDLRIPLFCHSGHAREIQLASRRFQNVQLAGLVKHYASGRPFRPVPGVRCQAFPVEHDGGPTFGFRIEEDAGSTAPSWAVGYATDLGSWDYAVASALANVDILALEFNHDVQLQVASGRARWLINRVLSDRGHLSNEQAARLVVESVRLSSSARIKHLIQLHLSGECNRPCLAAEAARNVITRLGLDVALHTAEQDRPGQTISLIRQTDHFSETG
jgi:phosphoribosyl 1,2-cyclic phosphodiesterase